MKPKADAKTTNGAHEGERILAELRGAIEDSGRTPGAIAKAAGLDRAGVWRFATGRTNSLTIESAALVAHAVGHELRLVKTPTTRRRKGGV